MEEKKQSEKKADSQAGHPCESRRVTTELEEDWALKGILGNSCITTGQPSIDTLLLSVQWLERGGRLFEEVLGCYSAIAWSF